MARASDSFFLVAIFRDQTFQMRQVRRVMFLAGLFVLQSTLILGVFYHYLLGEMVAGTGPMLFASEELQRLNSQIPGLTSVLGRWIIIMLLVNVLLTAAVAYYIMRKMGSPLLAIKRVLNEMAGGNLDVRLRSGDSDEFEEIVVALNAAVASMQEKIGAAQQTVNAVDLDDSKGANDNSRVQQALNECKQTLGYFETGKAADAAG